MHLLLTFDYELYGDGSGNVFQSIIEPTNDFLSICNKYDIKTTIFFEVAEYWKLKKEFEKGNKMGYDTNPAMAMEKQLKKAISEGHDIQLHIHPQWLTAKYENNRWIIDERRWRLAEVPMINDRAPNVNLENLILRGKSTIENILRPADNNYSCNVLRAGGFNIYPSQNVVKVMKKLGFIADSSVFPGGYADSRTSFFDYKNIDNKDPFWYSDHRVREKSPPGKSKIIEFPVFADYIKRYKKYDLTRIKIALKNKNANIDKIKNKISSKSFFGKVKYLFQTEALTWDFCLFSFKKMKSFLKAAKKIQSMANNDFHPFVLIGHSKEFVYPGQFEKFIRHTINDVEYLTMNQAIEKIKSL
jgi:hypothetical protein